MSIPQNVLTRDADMKTQSYQGMSREYAAAGHSWLAVHAQVASDLAAADHAALLSNSTTWDRDAVADSIANLDLDGSTARDAAYATREAISAGLDDIAFEVWREYISGLDHLEGLPTVDLTLLQQGLEERFAHTSAEEYLGYRLTEAEEGSARAASLAADTASIPDAIVAQYDADVAAFEAWLLQRSITIKDFHFTQYEMLWSLGMAAVASLPPLPGDAEAARHMVLSRLAWAIGPVEAPDFLTYVLNPNAVAL